MILMKTLLAKAGKRGDFGLELEVEAQKPLPEVVGWTKEKDNSLRGDYTAEYILTEPTNMGALLEARVGILLDALKPCKLIMNSPRTSFHVHRNILNISPTNLWSAAIAWWLFEDYIIEAYCNVDSRRDNHFCLPLSKAADLMSYAMRFMQATQYGYGFNDDAYKYGAQNIWSICKLGSVEYRCMDGDMTIDRAMNWLSLINDLYTNTAKHFKDPIHMIKVLDQDDGFKKLFNTIFPTQGIRMLEQDYKKMEDMSRNSISFAMTMAFCQTDWAEYEDVLANKKQPPVRRGLRAGQVIAPEMAPQGFGLDVEAILRGDV